MRTGTVGRVSRQIAVRLSDELVDEVDRLVTDGHFASRSDAVRRGLDALLDDLRRLAVGDAIAAGYRQLPPAHEEVEAARMAAICSIEAEPW